MSESVFEIKTKIFKKQNWNIHNLCKMPNYSIYFG